MSGKPFVHPRRQPRGKKYLYCRLCDVELLAVDRMNHDSAEPHASLIRALKAWEDIDAATGGYRCPGRVYYFEPWAALVDNILYDGRALQRMGAVVADRGVSPTAPASGPVTQLAE